MKIWHSNGMCYSNRAVTINHFKRLVQYFDSTFERKLPAQKLGSSYTAKDNLVPSNNSLCITFSDIGDYCVMSAMKLLHLLIRKFHYLPFLPKSDKRKMIS